jgi:protein involved in polysaccharide export with SLBB domain
MALVLTAVAVLSAGCQNGFLDPTEMGRFQKKPLVVNILKNMDIGMEEPNQQYANATNVRPEDLVPGANDYSIGPNDLLTIVISNLVAPGADSVRNARVTESGMVSLPLLGQIKAAGLTEAQLEAAIQQTYRDRNLIRDADVSVTVLESRNRTFTIYGAVARGGQYQILQSDFRLMDALALALAVQGSAPQGTGIEYIYVIRRTDLNPAGGASPQTAPANPATRPANDMLIPRSGINGANDPIAMAQHRVSMMTQADDTQPAAGAPAGQPTEPATGPAGNPEGRVITIEGQQVPAGQETPGATPTAQPGGEMAPPGSTTQGFEFNAPTEPTNVRIIRVPLDELLGNGQFRYNIVVRSQDFIYVPNPQIGEYYMGGHVGRVGVYSLSGRKITLKQAVIAAGMLDQLAIPQRTQIVRRIPGTNQEVFTMVDLAKIFSGEQPDLYLKPDDQVQVGTHFVAPFIAAVRNGFRITYGFGFLYDRNYAPTNVNQ